MKSNPRDPIQTRASLDPEEPAPKGAPRSRLYPGRQGRLRPRPDRLSADGVNADRGRIYEQRLPCSASSTGVPLHNGLPLLVRSLDDYKKAYKNEPHPELAGIVFNDSDSSKPEHNRSRKAVQKVAKGQGWEIFDGQLSHSDSYPTGARAGKLYF